LEGRDCDYFSDEMVDGIDEILRDFLRSRKMSKYVYILRYVVKKAISIMDRS